MAEYNTTTLNKSRNKKYRRISEERIKKYKMKIFLMRVEEIALLSVIVLLLFRQAGSMKQTTIAKADGISRGDIRKQMSVVEVEDEFQWLLEHEESFPENKIQASQGNPELIHFLYAYGNGAYESGQSASLNRSEKEADIPLLMQWDERWGFESYGSSVIGITGCGPTCLSMVITGLTDQEDVTPKAVADYAMENGYYIYGTGTKWALFSDLSKKYGIQCNEVSVEEETIKSELEKGNPIICSMGPGKFTTAGHFIVIAGEKDGKLIINDPNNIALSRQEWSYEEIENEIVHAWSFM